jgi:hypothetical protein
VRPRVPGRPVPALLVLLVAACHGTLATEPGGPVAFQTIAQAAVPGQTGTARREVVRDAAAWRAVWDELRAGEPLPAVDFATEMVVVAAMENQPCVSRVTIRAIALERGTLAVDVLEAPPAPNCVCVVSERPFHLVRLRRLDAPARFTVERGQTSC